MYKFGTVCYLGLRLPQLASVNCAGLCDFSNRATGAVGDRECSLPVSHFHESVHAVLETIILQMRREKTCILASVSRNFRIVIVYMLAGVLAR